jgi:hypothetical protein
MQSIAPSRLVSASHKAVVVGPNEINWRAGGMNLEFSMFTGPVASTILTAPVFDITSLGCLKSIKKYMQWLYYFVGPFVVGQVESTRRTFEGLHIPPTALHMCVRRMPGPLLCSWAQSWKNAELGDIQAASRTWNEFDADFKEIQSLLHNCEPLYSAVITDQEEAPMYLCRHMRAAVASRAARAAAAGGFFSH